MSTTADFLCELGTEELPPKNLQRLSTAFAEGIAERLQQQGLAFGAIQAYASPRRLAVRVDQLQLRQADQTIERRGPALKAAFDADGRPTKAALGFAASCGTTVEELERRETEKGSWLYARQIQLGQPAEALLPDIVADALQALPVAKRMRWGNEMHEFVRPVHWLVLLLGDAIVDAEILGLRAGRESRGHRFMGQQQISIPNPASYAKLLEEQGKVIAHFGDRREKIRGQLETLATELGATAVVDAELLDEVTALVEWPVAIAGRFDERFLAVPAEALISTMSSNQKYFHLRDQQGSLLPQFVTISNIDSPEPDWVRRGNERVIRPRFEDAAFFYQKDLKQGLASHRAGLDRLVFESRLGSVGDRSRRMAQLVTALAAGFGVDDEAAVRAAELCKCDLLTEMVGEFPDLQGIMGRYYATAAGEPAEVAAAIAEHYQPRGASDELPASNAGRLLALADRLDLLAGIFGIGKEPTGAKDPFGLRRAALGVIRILVEAGLRLNLRAAVNHAIGLYPDDALAQRDPERIVEFVMQRLRHVAGEAGLDARVIQSVERLEIVDPLDALQRMHAVAAFLQLDSAQSLAAANKRVANILARSEQAPQQEWDQALLQEPAECALAEDITAMRSRLQPLLADGRYQEGLTQLAGLRTSVDRFFDEVLVNHEDPALRDNRLALLSGLRGLFLGIADISLLQAA